MQKIIQLLILFAFQLNYVFAADQIGSIKLDREGRFFANFRSQKINVSGFPLNINSYFDLNNDHTWVLLSEETSPTTGVMHQKYGQLFKGIKVQQASILVRSKDGFITSISGRMLPQTHIPLTMQPSIQFKNITDELIQSERIQNTIYYETPELIWYFQTITDLQLAYKVRLDGINADSKPAFYEYFINAHNGKIIQKISKINNDDVNGTGKTLYKGVQTMISNFNGSNYSLLDVSRGIVTMDVGGSLTNYGSGTGDLYLTSHPIIHSSSDWADFIFLQNIEIVSSTNPYLLSNLNIDENEGTGNALSYTFEGYKGDTTHLIKEINGSIRTRFSASTLTNDKLYIDVAGYDSIRINIYRDSFNRIPENNQLQFAHRFEDSKVSMILKVFTPGTILYEDPNISATVDFLQSPHPAVDIHWGIGQVRDYFLTQFGRDSYDGAGGIVRNYFNGIYQFYGYQNNAFALGHPYNVMVYGTGEGNFNPLVSLDITGHEFTHLIVDRTSGLEYYGESGALNESFADIMGISIDAASDPVGFNWLLGDEVNTDGGFMRNLESPKNGFSYPQPDTYKGEYWQPTRMDDPDNGGVHYNSGVGNYWYYLLCEGGSGVNDNQYHYQISPIGMNKAQKIAYSTFTEYLIFNSQYLDAYYASLEAVQDLYGDTNTVEYQTVKAAWHAVGIPEQEVVPEEPDPMSYSVKFYPNPASNGLTIHVDDEVTYEGTIINLLSQVCLIFNAKPGVRWYDITNLAPGTYLLQLRNPARKEIIEKLVKIQ